MKQKAKFWDVRKVKQKAREHNKHIVPVVDYYWAGKETVDRWDDKKNFADVDADTENYQMVPGDVVPESEEKMISVVE